jgi:hypothetical protein
MDISKHTILTHELDIIYSKYIRMEIYIYMYSLNLYQEFSSLLEKRLWEYFNTVSSKGQSF